MLAISLTKQLLHISAAAKAISESLGQNSQKRSKEEGGQDKEEGEWVSEEGDRDKEEGGQDKEEGGRDSGTSACETGHVPPNWASCHLWLLPMLSSKVATRRMVDYMSTINLLVR